MEGAPTLDSGRNPFELLLLGVGILTGLPLLFGAPPPQSIAHLLSPVLVHVWALFLLGGSVTALIGVWWMSWGRFRRLTPEVGTGLLVERLGLVSVGIGTVIYGVGIVSLDVPGRGIAAGIAFAYGLACFWRSWQITRWVRAAIRSQGEH